MAWLIYAYVVRSARSKSSVLPAYGVSTLRLPSFRGSRRGEMQVRCMAACGECWWPSHLPYGALLWRAGGHELPPLMRHEWLEEGKGPLMLGRNLPTPPPLGFLKILTGCPLL
jgi:hypothetical protein